MRCDACGNWATSRVTRYGDGSEVVNWQAPDGSGRCSALELDTALDFGCTKFVAGIDHVVVMTKTGSPHHHWKMIICPTCSGACNSGKCKCAGTGFVRLYDDGYVGDELTRVHPKDKVAGPPRCAKCGETIDARWKVCPMCGGNLEPVADVEQVSGLGNAGGIS